MSKGRGWDRQGNQDKALLNSMLKKIAVEKQEVITRFSELQALDPTIRAIVAESVLCEWDNESNSYQQVGQVKLGDLLSGRSRLGWTEPRLAQVLGDTLDCVSEAIVSSDMPTETMQLDYISEMIASSSLPRAILPDCMSGVIAGSSISTEAIRLDRRLSYMCAFWRLFTAYFGLVLKAVEGSDWATTTRLRLRHKAAEFNFRGAQICYSYDSESLWCFLDSLQRLHCEVKNVVALRALHLNLTEREWKYQDQTKRLHLNKLLGWELPE